jgi:PAS domain S-box-containing protein
VTKLILRLERLHGDEVVTSSAPPPRTPGLPAHHVVDLGDHGRAPAASTPLARWIATAAAAHDPCLVLDVEGQVLSVSTRGAELLGCSDVAIIGRKLLDVIDLVDFETGGSSPDYALRIAPIAVLSPRHGLMRSLLRVRQSDGSRQTVDASAAPIHDAHGDTVGSFTFMAPVG